MLVEPSENKTVPWSRHVCVLYVHVCGLRVCSIHIFFGYIFSFRYDILAIVSYRWDFLWANQSFTQHKSDKVKRKWPNIENNLCRYLCKASSGLFFFSLLRPQPILPLFFFAYLSGSFESGPWSFAKLSFILGWMKMYLSKSRPIFYTSLSIFRVRHIHIFIHISTSFTFIFTFTHIPFRLLRFCKGCIFVFILSVRCAIHSVIQIVMWCVHTFCLSHKSTKSQLNDLGIVNDAIYECARIRTKGISTSKEFVLHFEYPESIVRQ